MKCRVCGTVNSDGVERCKSCGHPLQPGGGGKKNKSGSPGTASASAGRDNAANAGEKKTSSKAISIGFTFVAMIIMGAISLLQKTDDSSVKFIYFILIAAASIGIPIIQLVLQRRLASEEYPSTLDKIHDYLEPTLRKVISPEETMKRETYANTTLGGFLIVLTSHRLIWIEFKKSKVIVEAKRVFALDLEDITFLKYSKLTGNLALTINPRGKLNFRLPAVLANVNFSNALYSAAVDAAERSVKSAKSHEAGIYSLCIKCGNPTEKKEQFCRLHK